MLDITKYTGSESPLAQFLLDRGQNLFCSWTKCSSLEPGPHLPHPQPYFLENRDEAMDHILSDSRERMRSPEERPGMPASPSPREAPLHIHSLNSVWVPQGQQPHTNSREGNDLKYVNTVINTFNGRSDLTKLHYSH